MTTFDARPALAALLAHLNAHPHLAANLFGVSNLRDHRNDSLAVQPYPVGHGNHLVTLAEWSRTLTDCQPVEVTHVDGDRVHLDLRGKLVDGTPVVIYNLPNPEQVDLLAANLPVVEGAEFDVETLYRLTSSADAEQVSA